MEKLKKLESRFAGSLLGVFCGDALGMAVEGFTRSEIQSRFGELREMEDARLGKGAYTDDTQMTIGLAESLLRRRGFDGADMARTMAGNFEADRGYGSGARRAIAMIEDGVPWDRVGPAVFEGGSFGNGCAMRVAPVGLLYHENPEKCRLVARDTARITHSSELGMEGANIQAQAVAMAVRLAGRSVSPRGFVGALSDHIDMHGGPFRGKLATAGRLLSGTLAPDEVARELGNGVSVIDSVPTAIYAFASHLSSFEEAVVWAVNLGGDTDTIGAMTGAVAGAYHGVEAIPDRWLDVLENGPKGRDYVRQLAVRLAAFASGLPEGEPCSGCAI